jgi:hypothetical protein
MLILLMPVTSAQAFESPKLLILGDSQLTFGGGRPFLRFFKDINKQCETYWNNDQHLPNISASTGIIGVRSTSIHSWIARDGKSKGMVCDKDPKWGVNARTLGVNEDSKRKFEQIGELPHNKFCEPHLSPFEAMFRPGYYDPELFIMFFLGNSTGRWDEEPALAKQDLEHMLLQIPKDIPCILLTTIPTHKPNTNDKRQLAQQAMMDAFNDSLTSHCTLVSGVTETTRNMSENNTDYFFQKKNGKFDPYHPSELGARKFLDNRSEDICDAIRTTRKNHHRSKP